jgi:D-serine deaminase-like pyridoxal phosphate-dependent protein
MVQSVYGMIDTPALLVDREIMMRNIKQMQEKADEAKVGLRPHIKTHRMPELALLQLEYGAAGITVAKVGEAEVMAAHGIKDIFIANEIVGVSKLERIRALAEEITIRLGVDSEFHIDQLAQVFQAAKKPIEVLIELEVGENRSGVISDEQLMNLAKYIQKQQKVVLKGIFSHEGHTYKARDVTECRELAVESQRRTLRAANLVRQAGIPVDIVSIGATPSLMQTEIIEGITEIRPGTYIFMDAGQANALNDFSVCAATVLVSIISKPTDERVVFDAGAKTLTTQNRPSGICSTEGLGYVKNSENVRVSGLFDEHGLINDKRFRNIVSVGDKVEVIPNHICPTCSLYEKAYLVSAGSVVKEIPVLCRGKSQ